MSAMHGVQSELGGPIPLLMVHWNRPWECLRSVDAFLSEGLPLAITVVDNASESDAIQLLKERLPEGLRLVLLRENKGWGGALNIGLRRWLLEEKSKCCLVSAHDALPRPGCLRRLLEVMAVKDSCVGIASAEVGINNRPTFSPVRGPRLPRVKPRDAGLIEEVDFPQGTLMLFHRKCIEGIGFFDERYFAYGDETEIGLRARRHGWKVVVVWGAVVENPGTWTPSRMRSYLFTRNCLIMARDYGGWDRAVLRALLTVPNTIRLLARPSERGAAFSVTARAMAIRDFFLQRYGPPPAWVLR